MRNAKCVFSAAAAAAAIAVRAAAPAAPAPAPAKPAFAAMVGSNVLSAAEADARGKVLLEDERRFNMLSYTPDMQQEAEAHYRNEAVERWICNKVLADEARRLGFKASAAEISAQILKMDSVLRRKRGVTADKFIKSCPFGEDVLRADIENAVLIDKLLAAEVFAKIPVSDAEMLAAVDAARAANAKLKPGARKAPETAAAAIVAVRRKKFPAAFRAWYAGLRKKAAVKKADSPRPPAKAAPAKKPAAEKPAAPRPPAKPAPAKKPAAG